MLSALQMQWMPTLAVGVEAVLSLVKCSMTRPGSLSASIEKKWRLQLLMGFVLCASSSIEQTLITYWPFAGILLEFEMV